MPNQVPLCDSTNVPGCPLPTVPDNTKESAKVKALRGAWLQKKSEIFAGKLTKPDAEDPDTVNHLNWYLSTGFVRPYPGESTVRPPSDFNNSAPAKPDLDD